MNDLYEALIECSTPVVASAAEGYETLAALRRLIHGTGAGFIGGGLHPHVAFGDLVHVEADRYQAIRHEMRGLVSRTPTAALHVHVGMPDPETAIDVCNRMRAHLPLLSGAGGPVAVLVRPRLRPGQRAARRSSAASRAPPSRPRSRAGSTTWTSSAGARDGGGRRTTRTCGGTSGRARSWARSRSARWTRRAGWSPSPGSRRSCTRSPSPARTARKRRRRPPKGSWSPHSAPRATAWTRRSGGAARSGRSARWAPTRSRSPGPTPASSTARTRSRRSSASCARAVARAACARLMPPAGWTRCSRSLAQESYASTQTTSPIRSQS